MSPPLVTCSRISGNRGKRRVVNLILFLSAQFMNMTVSVENRTTMVRRTVTAISVEDVEKRREPSKHYVYLIYVTWSDGSINLIFRRYNSFFELQSKLLEKFPDESGVNDPSRRIIPFLPGKIIFGRSHIRDVAVKRLQPINEYCKTLIKLPTRISESDEVLQFLEATPDDLNPRAAQSTREGSKDHLKNISEPKLLDQYIAKADYVKEGRNETSLREGQIVQVIEKTETGWWFVNSDYDQGWVPSSYLEREDGLSENRVIKSTKGGDKVEKYIVIEPYKACMSDEISLEKGVIVNVLERNLDGWWLVKYKSKKGRAPSTNLVEAGTLQADRLTNRAARKSASAVPVEKVPNMMAVSNIHLQNFNQESPPGTSSSRSGKGTYRQVSFESFTSSSEEDTMYSSIDEGAAEASRKNLRRSKSAVSDSPYKRVNLPRRSSGSMREVKPRPPRPPPPAMTVSYTVIEDFVSQADDGLSLRKGQQVQVLEKNTTGWWLVIIGGNRGWAPGSYIQEQKNPKPARPPPPNFNKRIPGVVGKTKPISASKTTSVQSPKIMFKSKNNMSTPVSKAPTEPTITDTLVQIGDGRSSDIKSELESKFGVKLKKGTTPGSPNLGAGVRKSGHVPSKALQPQSTVKPSVFLSQSRGPIGSHFGAIKPQQEHQDKNTPVHDDNTLDSDHIYANMSDEENEVFSQSVTNSSTSSKRHPYVNLDDKSEEPKTVLHRARAVYDFRQAEEGEISIITGQKVEVLKDDVSGWSFVRNTDGVQGWCPANYLVKIENIEDSDGDHDYQNEDFPVGRPPTSEGIPGKNITTTDSEAEKPKFDISDITKVKLKPTTSQTSSGDSSTGVGKPLLPVKPTKALKPPVVSKKPAITTAKPQSPKTKQKPSVSAKPKVNGTKNTQCTSVQKLAKSFNQK